MRKNTIIALVVGIVIGLIIGMGLGFFVLYPAVYAWFHHDTFIHTWNSMFTTLDGSISTVIKEAISRIFGPMR